jgi:two-component system sensor histidine kinase YesM
VKKICFNKAIRASENLHTLKIRLIATFLFLIIIPIFLISIFATVLYRKSMDSKINEIVENNMLQTTQIIDERLDSYRNLLYQIVADQNIIDIAHKINNATTELEKAYEQQTMMIALSDYVKIKSYCTSATYLSNSNFAVYDKTLSASETVWNDARYRNLFLQLCQNKESITYLSGIDIQIGKDNRLGGLVYLGFPIHDLVTKKHLGILVLGLDSSIFRYNANLQRNQKELTNWAGIQSVVVSEKKNVVSTCYESVKDNQESIITIKKGSDHLIMHQIPNSKWCLITTIDFKVLFGDINNMERWLIIIAILITLIYFFILLFTMNRMERSIVKIADGIQNYTPGKDHIAVNLKPSNEFYIIIQELNETALKNSQLIEELKKRSIEIAKETDKRRKAELKALEAQINPHFIYNILDSINWMAIDSGQAEISKMLASLGSIMRYSATNIDILVAFQAEIEWMKKYVFLQQERYGNAFRYECHAEERTMSFPIYKMLLQPLVENAIQHGFEGIHSGGVLKLNAHLLNDGRLEIKVSDNGCGIDGPTLERIQEQIDGAIPIEGSAIGVSNVINRIRLYYSSKAVIHIESRLGEGTIVTLVLPDNRIDERNVE